MQRTLHFEDNLNLNCLSGRHEAYYRSERDQTVIVPPDIDRPQNPETPVHFKEGELVNFEYSYKVSTLRLLLTSDFADQIISISSPQPKLCPCSPPPNSA